MSHPLIVILSLYLAYTDIKMLSGVPFSQWKLEQYLLAVVAAAFLITAAYFSYLIFKEKKKPTP